MHEMTSLNRFSQRKVLVVGDLILDTYTIGKCHRISPEAPVPVVRVDDEDHRPGGAGNVMLNLLSLGCNVVAMGRVGNDAAGKKLLQGLEGEGVDVSGIVEQEDWPTPVKNRIIAGHQQIVRVDREVVTPMAVEVEESVIDALPLLMDRIDIVAISDYAKGTLSTTLLQRVIEAARRRSLPVIADPKGVDFAKYSGVHVLKPNNAEAMLAAGLETDASIDDVAKAIMSKTVVEWLMITRSEAGISLFSDGGFERRDFPVVAREVKDGTGAGDTVLAMLTAALANGFGMIEAIELSNVAAGIAIERLGCARITLSELALRHHTNKVFDEEHHFALQESLKGKICSLVVVDTGDGFDVEAFRHIQRLYQQSAVGVYVADASPDALVVDLLASLKEVSFIVLKGQGLDHLCGWLQPQHIFDARTVMA